MLLRFELAFVQAFLLPQENKGVETPIEGFKGDMRSLTFQKAPPLGFKSANDVCFKVEFGKSMSCLLALFSADDRRPVRVECQDPVWEATLDYS